MLTPNVKKNGLGAFDMARLTKGIDLIKEGFGLSKAPSVDEIYDGRFMPPLKDRNLLSLPLDRRKTRRPRSARPQRLRRDRRRRPCDMARGADTHGAADADQHVDRQGEFAAVVGPSGCGKSSLMKLVTGLLPPTGGTRRRRGRRRSTARSRSSAWRSRTRRCCRGATRSTTSCCRWRSCSRIAARLRGNRKPNTKSSAREPAATRSASAASRTSSPGCCRAACSSAPASAAR